jgi:hypothetical protein
MVKFALQSDPTLSLFGVMDGPRLRNEEEEHFEGRSSMCVSYRPW